MTHHKEVKILPYTAAQMFELVAAVDQYDAFLPWCIKSHVKKREGDVFYADLIIGYKLVREKFSSKVTARGPNHIFVDYLSGPMKYLKNSWHFHDNDDGTCTIDFYVEFEFKNKMFQKLAGVFFDEAFKRMVSAFEKRANEVYGKGNNQKDTASSDNAFSPSK